MSLCHFLREAIEAKLSKPEDYEDLGEDEKSEWITIISGAVSTLLLIGDQQLAQELTVYIMNYPKLVEMLVD